MPNTIAYAALLIWPVITLFLVLAMPAHRAVIWSLVGAYMFLPVRAAFDLKGVPTLDKSSIPNLATFLLALLLARKGAFRWPRSTTVNVLMLCFVISPILTGLANPDPISIGGSVLPAMDLYDSLASAAGNAIALLPFILGAGLLRDEASLRDLLVVFVLAGLIYTLPVLAEIRLSPFLQAKVYHIAAGEFFSQQVRGTGFRAMAFMGHGLLVSTFLGLSVLAAAGLWKMKQIVWMLPSGLCLLILAVVLVLNKSVGAIFLAAGLFGLLMALSPRRFLSVAVVFGFLLVTYPMLRANHVIPVEKIEEAAKALSSDRASSFAFRLRNEDILLNKADDRPLFGWGTFGRNRIFTVTSSGSAFDLSVTDGTWIVALGVYGWFGYIALFGLLSYPLWHMFKLRRRITSPVSATVAAMLILNLIDLVPNSSLKPITWLIVGALSGLAVTQQRALSARRGGVRPPAAPASQPAAA